MAVHPVLEHLLAGSGDDVILEAAGRPCTRGQLIARTISLANGSSIQPGQRVAVPRPSGLESLAWMLAVHLRGGIAWLDAQPGAGEYTPDTSSPLTYAVATSGSTGAPKRVALTVENVRSTTVQIGHRLDLDTHDRVLCAVPLSHTYGLSTLWCAIAASASILLPTLPMLGGDLSRQAADATVLVLVPTQLRTLVAAVRANGALFPRLRMVTLAGQRTSPAERQSAAASFPGVDFIVCYGMTEATTRVTMQRAGDFLSRPDCVGTALPHVATRLRDGELLVRGPSVAAGYFDNPVASNMAFANDELRTGDCAELVQGEWRILGRKDGMVKRYGEKVFPEQVEAAIAPHPCVADVAVRAETRDQGEPLLIARLVLSAPVSDAELRRDLKSLLPPQALPDRFERVDEIERTSTGKVRYRGPGKKG